MAVDTRREPRYAEELRFLWKVALAVFVVTIAIGVINGQRVVTLDHRAERPRHVLDAARSSH